jgi:type IV pilus assembly protein PilA
MLHKIRDRRQNEEGFTLIELMVVVLIIAILLAIAIPTFLGARKKAQDRAAQSNLRNALTAEKTYYTDFQLYSATITDMTTIEPNLRFHATDPTAGIVLKTAGTPAQSVVCLTRTSASGQVFAIWESATDGTYYGKTTQATGCAADVTAAQTAGFVTTGW